MFDSSDFFPALSCQVRVLDCIPESVTDELAAAIVALILPRCVDIAEERLGQTDVDVCFSWLTVITCIRIGNTNVLHSEKQKRSEAASVSVPVWTGFVTRLHRPKTGILIN